MISIDRKFFKKAFFLERKTLGKKKTLKLHFPD